jgi:hypothetical protein
LEDINTLDRKKQERQSPCFFSQIRIYKTFRPKSFVIQHYSPHLYHATKGREDARVALEHKITKEKYEFALAKVEELLPLVDDSTPANDKIALELSVMSDIVIAYEKMHFPIV